MKKRILGITALLAVLAMVLAFTTCDGLLGGEKDDGIERTVNFINHSSARIAISCQGSPAYFILEKAKSQNDNDQSQLVTRTGKDIVLTTISILDPTTPDDGWDIVEFAPGSSAAAGKQGKNGVSLIAGTIIFQAVRGNGLIDFKVDTIPQDN